MNKERNKYDRPESYPKPTETDEQLKNQPEFIDQEPNTYTREISDIPEHEEEDAPNVNRVTDGGTSGGRQ
ncbi:MAG TPA: hypothetical protein VGE66_02795 [Chitinophagaceae bacterium]